VPFITVLLSWVGRTHILDGPVFGGWVKVKVPWLYNEKTKIMISYEDPESITAKANYVIQKQLGGMMFWDLGQDDSKSTLLNTIHNQLGDH
jgi:chitinase